MTEKGKKPPPEATACPPVPVGVRMSESGNSSKLDVSSMLLISMGMAAGLSLRKSKAAFGERPFLTWGGGARRGT